MLKILVNKESPKLSPMICVMESSVCRRWAGIMAIPISLTRLATPSPATEASASGPGELEL